jgi:hypothetical protein
VWRLRKNSSHIAYQRRLHDFTTVLDDIFVGSRRSSLHDPY